MSLPLSSESAPANSNDSPIHNNERCITYESDLNFMRGAAISSSENPLLPFGNYTIVNEDGEVANFDGGFSTDEKVYLRYDDFEDVRIELIPRSDLSNLVLQLINENENQLALVARQRFAGRIGGSSY